MEKKVKLKCKCGSFLQQKWFGKELITCLVWIFKCPNCNSYWKVQLFEGKFSVSRISEEEAKDYMAGVYSLKN